MSLNVSSLPIPSFTKLGETNFQTWQYDMQACLMQRGLWLIVNGEDPAPSDRTTDDYLSWRMKDMQAAGFIYSLVEATIYPLIREYIDSGSSMWTTIKSHFSQDNAASRFMLLDDFFSIHKK